MKLSGEYTIGFGTDKNNPARYTVAEDAKIFKIDTDGVITAVSLKSITTDENDTVLYTLDDGQITNLFVQEVNAKNEDKVNGDVDGYVGNVDVPTGMGAANIEYSVNRNGRMRYKLSFTAPEWAAGTANFLLKVYDGKGVWIDDITVAEPLTNGKFVVNAITPAGDDYTTDNGLKFELVKDGSHEIFTAAKIKFIGADGKAVTMAQNTATTLTTAAAGVSTIAAAPDAGTYTLASGKTTVVYTLVSGAEFDATGVFKTTGLGIKANAASENIMQTGNIAADCTGYVVIKVEDIVARTDIGVKVASGAAFAGAFNKLDNTTPGTDILGKDYGLANTNDDTFKFEAASDVTQGLHEFSDVTLKVTAGKGADGTRGAVTYKVTVTTNDPSKTFVFTGVNPDSATAKASDNIVYMGKTDLTITGVKVEVEQELLKAPVVKKTADNTITVTFNTDVCKTGPAALTATEVTFTNASPLPAGVSAATAVVTHSTTEKANVVTITLNRALVDGDKVGITTGVLSAGNTTDTAAAATFTYNATTGLFTTP